MTRLPRFLLALLTAALIATGATGCGDDVKRTEVKQNEEHSDYEPAEEPGEYEFIVE